MSSSTEFRLAGNGKIPPGSPAPTDTFARYSRCLARASLLGSRRRCRLARVAAPLASSLDFLQGTLEKIHFHRLLRQQPLQLPDLLAQLRCAGNRFPMLHRLQLISPLVQKPPMYTQFLRQRPDVIAAL